MDSNQKRVQTGGVLHAFYAIERDNGHRLRELVKIDYARTRPPLIGVHNKEHKKESYESVRVALHSIQ